MLESSLLFSRKRSKRASASQNYFLKESFYWGGPQTPWPPIYACSRLRRAYAREVPPRAPKGGSVVACWRSRVDTTNYWGLCPQTPKGLVTQRRGSPLRGSALLPAHHTISLSTYLSVKLGVWGGHRPRLHSKMDLWQKGPSRALVSQDLSIRP